MSLVSQSPSIGFSDDIAPPSSSSSSSSTHGHASYSSPSRKAGLSSTHPGKLQFNALAGPSHHALVPLAPAKTVVAVTRRAVNFSPRPETKYFRSSDSIIPSSDDPPPASIRSYFDLETIPCSSPFETPPLARSSSLRSSSETPSLVRGILKSRVQNIRLASTVEEGTLNNKEPARLIVTGKRPRILARDSFQVAMMRKAASEEFGEAEMDKGKGKMLEDPLGSDDSVFSDEGRLPEDQRSNASSEEEEEVEEDGELALASIVKIIIAGAEDLLTLEEAYNIISARLRQRIHSMPNGQASSPASHESIRLATQPLKDEAPAVVRAFQRDLQRLLGKVPGLEGSPVEEAQPFAGLKPLKNSPPTTVRSRFTPSPSVTPPARSPNKAARQGYTESEVRYRREASGVGSAALRFLAFVFHEEHLWECFTEADLTSLLDHVLRLPRTPKLPTPNPKRSYWLAIAILAQLKLPQSCIEPLKDRIVRAIESAIADGLWLATTSIASALLGSVAVSKEGGQIKKEAYHAIVNLVNTYPSEFFGEYSILLPPCLKGMTSSSPMIRNKASAAVAAFVTAKLNMLNDVSSHVEWARNRTMIQRSETFVVNQLKSKSTARCDWTDLERQFKATVGTANGVAWACASWSLVVSLMGQAYDNSGVVSGTNTMDHIIDRSLFPTTNLVRPLLASVAWSHAIHAYLLAHSAISISPDQIVTRSYSPWSGDWKQRLSSVLLPVSYALEHATDSKNFKTVLQLGRWAWQREEQTKKTSWMITTGRMAASVVYAYSGVALNHVDQPAVDISALTGIPSSDGAPVAEDAEDIAKLDRLDKTWDRVVQPIIKQMSSVCGVDDLKIHAWEMLHAITELEGANIAWSLERLCSPTYLSGEIFAAEKEPPTAELMVKLEREVIKPDEIPSWGAAWVASRLERVLDLYQDVISSMTGLSKPIDNWVKDDSGAPLVPTLLSDIWTNIIRSLASLRFVEDSVDTPNQGLVVVLRHLLQILNRDPASHVPLDRLNEDGKTIAQADTFRLNLFAHLFNVIVQELGDEVIGSMRLQIQDSSNVDKFIALHALGQDSNGQATIAGSILGQLLVNPVRVFSPNLDNAARMALMPMISRLLDIGSEDKTAFRLLGDLTNSLPHIFEGEDDVRLDIWRIIAARWPATLESQPSMASASSTNHTGELLVTLLSFPFGATSLTSTWHQRASTDDLTIWQYLLQAIVTRFRAKAVGTNLGVLEHLAGHLRDLLLTEEKTSSTTITLSCLASALSYLSFVTPANGDITSINDDHIPVDFLAIVSNALLESYPSSETVRQSQGTPFVFSSGVALVLQCIIDVFASLPDAFVLPVLDACRPGVEAWMADDCSVADQSLNEMLDKLYITIISSLNRAVLAGTIPTTAATLSDLLDIYAPRLSRAQSIAVPQAFQAFWAPFSSLHADQLDDTVRSLAEQVSAAVPGLIHVPGLVHGETLSQDESATRYPHALGVERVLESSAEDRNGVRDAERGDRPGSRPQEEGQVLVDASEMEIDAAILLPDITTAYDADVSQLESQEEQPANRTHLVAPILDEGNTDRLRSPSPSTAAPPSAVSATPVVPEISTAEIDVPGGSSAESTEAQAGGDVFGPTAKPASQPKRGKKRARKSTSSRSKASDRASSASLSITSSTPIVVVAQEIDQAVVPSSDLAEDMDSSSVMEADDDPLAEMDQPLPGETSKELDTTAASIPEPSRQLAARPRPSLLSSAKGWLARVPSLGFLSPTDPTMSQAVAPGARTASANEPVPSLPSTPKHSGGAESKKRKLEDDETQTTPPAQTMPQKRPYDVIEILDDDDELLLTPESARKRRREEEEALRRDKKGKGRASRVSPVKRRKRSKILESTSSSNVTLQSRSGSKRDVKTSSSSSISVKSEDATTSPATPRVGAVQELEPVSPASRSTQQTRLLAMLDEAASSSGIVEDLDFDGVLALMRNVDALRQAAQGNLQRRAEEAREAKRAKR